MEIHFRYQICKLFPVAYLRKMVPMTKFKYAPFSIRLTLDMGTNFTKDKPWRK